MHGAVKSHRRNVVEKRMFAACEGIKAFKLKCLRNAERMADLEMQKCN
jgi:hypothetical protein